MAIFVNALSFGPLRVVKPMTRKLALALLLETERFPTSTMGANALPPTPSDLNVLATASPIEVLCGLF